MLVGTETFENTRQQNWQNFSLYKIESWKQQKKI